jgi:hydrogenase maturation protease
MTDAGPPSAGRRRGLVVGLGSVDRGDDAIGTIVAGRVADELRSSRASWVEVVALADPNALPDAMAGMDVVVVVDAVRSGREPGAVTCHEFGQDGSPLPAHVRPGIDGTHGMGLAMVAELARALDLLPARVVLVGVESVEFGHGQIMSTPVSGAVPKAVDAVLGILGVGTGDREAYGPAGDLSQG